MRTGRNWALLALLALASLAMAAPLLWTLLLSLKSNGDLLRSTGSAFSPPYTLQNYSDILGHSAVFGWMLNIARHQMFSALNLHNTYRGLILPGLAAPFGVFLMTQYFRAMPRELEEAAALDGASRFKIFWRILLPLSLPAQATLGIFTFLSTWNDYWWPLISATDSDMYTLTVGVASSQMNFAQTNGLGFLMAQAVFASVPILIVYVIFQRYIVAGVSRAAA